VLDRAKAALRARREADLALLLAAVEWAESHPSPGADDVAGWGDDDLYGEGFLPLAGEGASLVAEFAPLEFAASLGWSSDAAKSVMGDGLELKQRLPQLWGQVLELVVPVGLARQAAEHTRDLGPEAAAHADRLLTRDGSRLTGRRIKDLVDEARLYHDPDRAIDDERHALTSRKVEVRPGNTPATADVQMTLDTADAVAFESAVARGAEALKALGDGDPLDIRRARAVGVLADPQRALGLFDGVPPTPAKPAATMFLHLEEAQLLDLDTHPAAIRVEGLGVVSSDLLAMWLADTTVVVKPVLHTDRCDAVDRHDPPEWMADLVRGFAIRRASSPAADADPASAISTTSTRMCPSSSAGPAVRHIRATSPRSVAATTAPRPTPTGSTSACPTAATGGRHPRVASTQSCRHRRTAPDLLHQTYAGCRPLGHPRQRGRPERSAVSRTGPRSDGVLDPGRPRRVRAATG
jgi:hypothetical protein